jgi:hypothetical protein
MRDNPSITFLVATNGKKTLRNVLRSMYGQFFHGLDKFEVYFDGPDFAEVGPEYFRDELNLYKVGDLNFHVLPENLGYWGHGIRNTYQKTFTTDYIHHIDDDDCYIENVMPRVHKDLKDNYGKILMYRFRNKGVPYPQWDDPEIRCGNIGTPSGMIPNNPNIMGEWGYFYGGDAQFYEQTRDKIGTENIVWKTLEIVKLRPHLSGWL